MAAKNAITESKRIRRLVCEARASECYACSAPGVLVDEEDGSVYDVRIEGDRVDAQITVEDLAEGERILLNGRKGGSDLDKVFCDDCAVRS